MDSIKQQVLGLAPLIQALRRDLHQHPESAWTEYRTASIVARHLTDLGYHVTMGADAVDISARPQIPSSRHMTQAAQTAHDLRRRDEAIHEGADPHFVARMRNGLTGLWADMRCPDDNAPQGRVIAVRMDMDCNHVAECAEPHHMPARLGFASRHTGRMHACGHDGHTALGMGLAAILKTLRPQLHGTIRLIFQPAEEGGQGALPMLKAGAVRDVHTLLGLHVGVQAKQLGEIICGTTQFLATSTFEATFTGASAHAGIAPHLGRNALLATCTAVQNMHSIARHGDGETRINVGEIHAQGAPNIIPASAWLTGETRGNTTEINTYMLAEATRIMESAAHMWGCHYAFHPLGACPSGASSPEFADIVARVAHTMPEFTHIIPTAHFQASEDFTWLLNEVQKNGGQGTYIQLGASHVSGHHTACFDFDEAALPYGMELLARAIVHCMQNCP